MGKSLTVLFALACLAAGGCGDSETGGKSAPGITGSYTVDREALRPVFLEQVREDYLNRPEALTEENEAALEEMVDAVIGEMRLDLVISGDGTFELNQWMQGKPMKLEGTWKQDGEAVVFTTVKKNGAVQEKPGFKRASLRGGILRIRPDPALPFEFVMRRK